MTVSERVLDPAHVVVMVGRYGRTTHVADDDGRTLCGDLYGQVRLRTEPDPTCRWCRAAEEET